MTKLWQQNSFITFILWNKVKWKLIFFKEEWFLIIEFNSYCWQIQTKERETQQIKTLNQEFDQKIQGIANELNTILSKLKKKTNDIAQAKLEQKVRQGFSYVVMP